MIYYRVLAMLSGRSFSYSRWFELPIPPSPGLHLAVSDEYGDMKIDTVHFRETPDPDRKEGRGELYAWLVSEETGADPARTLPEGWSVEEEMEWARSLGFLPYDGPYACCTFPDLDPDNDNVTWITRARNTRTTTAPTESPRKGA